MSVVVPNHKLSRAPCPPRAIEALPLATSLPGTGSGLPAVLQYLVRHRDQPLQGLARLALDSAGHPRPSRRCPWPCLSLVPDPGCRQACSTR
ncbi:hypothetical protein [Aeromonas caviae]|uniref:hypothetical protein n=1 Tax=Aeromonas caviae TaxID=648 RepID=UPI0029DE53AE|nr:hypothetical protein [Aeromonas caviae]MDX7643844.1 hypothetical protein [Aeromonas caviae]